MIKMILDRPLVVASNDHNLFDSRLDQLFDNNLNHRFIHITLPGFPSTSLLLQAISLTNRFLSDRIQINLKKGPRPFFNYL